MKPRFPTMVITGASGFIGRHFLEETLGARQFLPAPTQPDAHGRALGDHVDRHQVLGAFNLDHEMGHLLRLGIDDDDDAPAARAIGTGDFDI